MNAYVLKFSFFVFCSLILQSCTSLTSVLDNNNESPHVSPVWDNVEVASMAPLNIWSNTIYPPDDCHISFRSLGGTGAYSTRYRYNGENWKMYGETESDDPSVKRHCADEHSQNHGCSEDFVSEVQFMLLRDNARDLTYSFSGYDCRW